MKKPISITALSSISSLGSSTSEVWDSYQKMTHGFTPKNVNGKSVWVSGLTKNQKREIDGLRNSDTKYHELDDSVLFAVKTARQAIGEAGWNEKTNFGVNIGSSRGATSLFENYHQEFLKKGNVSTLASPTTTLGNISSWVAHDLKSNGPTISHSITCSTALHALLNGVAWIQSGMSNRFLVGGSEAPLTPFTIAQIQALKIYSRLEAPYPCLALDLEKKTNSMVLGEGSSMACLEEGLQTNRLAKIEGVGYATEPLTHNVSISTDAQCFQDSMEMALNGISPEEVDVIVLHAPGTVKGDLSEYNAIRKVFCNKTPFLTTNKWKVGHTFGASGMLSVEMAILMLQHQEYLQVPFTQQETPSKSIEKIMVNAVGFGGNAVSVLLSK
ncbi:beta-ketoacyl synthase N-terminal-like domain-containing protein [Flagellimonas meridianipacifica]|uniref:beta-ketoacyl synthase N-terminal-like domain-containing protein n=1 Tax=Flagellimonas meridianipacifica TaxID=1080225 RepID=UPI000D06DA95|nr:beta-ketoacyl synthase N-terminal-like domain-containing protein [Allomuricauda pacifica]